VGSYRWALAGVVAEPYRISLDRFLGTVLRAPAPACHPHWVRFEHRVPWTQMGTYELCRAYGKHGRDISNSFGVALFDAGELVGSQMFSHLFIDPAYRGRGLGPELLAEYYVAFPEVICARMHTMIPRGFAESGEKAVRRAYSLLVERGAVLP
jgi:GNAT superfamily N-acetyltransferase